MLSLRQLKQVDGSGMEETNQTDTSQVTGTSIVALGRVRVSPQEMDEACKTLFPLSFLLATCVYAGAFGWPLLASTDAVSIRRLPIQWAE